MNKYREADLIACMLARIMCDLCNRPFLVAVGDVPGYDLRSVDGEVSIELKKEATPERTGNVALEYWNTDRDVPSGILATAANTWVHLLPENGRWRCFEFSIGTIRKLAMEHGTTKANGTNALLRLVPVEIFKQHARRSFGLDERFIPAGGSNEKPIAA